MAITLKDIYNELQEIKKRLDKLEQKLVLNDHEFSPKEITELNQISEKMAQGDKISWSPD